MKRGVCGGNHFSGCPKVGVQLGFTILVWRDPRVGRDPYLLEHSGRQSWGWGALPPLMPPAPCLGFPSCKYGSDQTSLQVGVGLMDAAGCTWGGHAAQTYQKLPLSPIFLFPCLLC